jgi:hypothetical protein
MDEGVKYLGFHLNPNKYKKSDWAWLIRKVESRIDSWVFRTLSRGGRLVLLKSVLEGITSVLELNHNHSQRYPGQDKKNQKSFLMGWQQLYRGVTFREVVISSNSQSFRWLGCKIYFISLLEHWLEGTYGIYR